MDTISGAQPFTPFVTHFKRASVLSSSLDRNYWTWVAQSNTNSYAAGSAWVVLHPVGKCCRLEVSSIQMQCVYSDLHKYIVPALLIRPLGFICPHRHLPPPPPGSSSRLLSVDISFHGMCRNSSGRNMGLWTSASYCYAITKCFTALL